MKKKQYRKGLTLIELLVTIVAASIVILTVALILIMAFRSWRIDNAYVDLRRDAALAIYLISRDIRESDVTDVTTAMNGILALKAHLPVRDAVTYTKSGNALTSTDFGTIIASGVQAFSNQYSGADDGVYVTLGLANNSVGVAITNRVFVNTRN
jgi:Tfp pilus assembly protein PilW